MNQALGMIEQWLLGIGAAIFGALGTAHLVFTYFSDKFETYDPKVGEAMKDTSPRITSDTSMWLAWVGFNASHSFGAMIFSSIYIYLVIVEYAFLKTSIFLLGLPVIVGAIYFILALRYWFRIPLLGISVATVCFLSSFIIHAIT